MRWYGLTALLTGLVLLGGCANQPVANGYHPELVSPYQLDAGDRVRVIVFGQPDLTNTYIVDKGGAIAMPLIGAVRARGRTVAEVETDIATQLRKGYIRSPDVSVEVDRYRPFFAMGEVGAPGQYPYVPGMTVQQAVAAAGGFTPRGETYGVQVTRSIGGRVETAILALSDPVLPGDTVFVSERHL